MASRVKKALVRAKSPTKVIAPLVVMLSETIRFRLKSTRSVRPTSKIIEEWKALATIPHDRAYSQTRAKALERDMQHGLFKSINWIKVYCKETKKWYRANGQHTSQLLGRVPKAILKQLKIIVESYEVNTLLDVAALLSRIDARASVKSPSNIYDYYASTEPKFKNTTSALRRLCASGIRYGSSADFGWQLPLEEVARLLVKEVDFCLWMQELSGAMHPPGGFNAASTAAVYKAYKRNRTKAKEFWTLVCKGNTEFCTPAGRLREFLQSHNVGGRVGYSKKITIPAKMLFDTANLMFDHHCRTVTDVPELTVKEIKKRLVSTAAKSVTAVKTQKKPSASKNRAIRKRGRAAA